MPIMTAGSKHDTTASWAISFAAAVWASGCLNNKIFISCLDGRFLLILDTITYDIHQFHAGGSKISMTKKPFYIDFYNRRRWGAINWLIDKDIACSERIYY